jgi:beta-lactamase superfamily II metal-dependent hydrolase
MRVFSVVATCIMLTAAFLAETPAAKSLDIYIVDVEGGNATLVVAPSGESILIDTGNLNAAARDAGRIMEAIQDAGLNRIDHLVTTHWHLDHFGGMAALAGRIPIREFIDHGANVQPNPKADAFLKDTYPQLYQTAVHRVVKAGDTIPVWGLAARIVTSAGDSITTPLPDAGRPNLYCTNRNPEPEDPSENAQSIGIHITFGRFRFLHLGDLTSNKEFELMCPDNRLGKVDLFVVSHHGQKTSNREMLVHAIESRVAVMNNSIRKGGEPEVMKILHSAPGLEDLWQLHFSELSGQEYTVPGMFIANHADVPKPVLPLDPITGPKSAVSAQAQVHNGIAYWIKVSARPDGSFTVTNGRTGFAKTYRARRNSEE